MSIFFTCHDELRTSHTITQQKLNMEHSFHIIELTHPHTLLRWTRMSSMQISRTYWFPFCTSLRMRRNRTTNRNDIYSTLTLSNGGNLHFQIRFSYYSEAKDNLVPHFIQLKEVITGVTWRIKTERSEHGSNQAQSRSFVNDWTFVGLQKIMDQLSEVQWQYKFIAVIIVIGGHFIAHFQLRLPFNIGIGSLILICAWLEKD